MRVLSRFLSKNGRKMRIACENGNFCLRRMRAFFVRRAKKARLCLFPEHERGIRVRARADIL